TRGRDVVDVDGHGTLAASIIAGRRMQRRTFVGMAPEARIVPVKVVDHVKETIDSRKLGGAITTAVKAGAKVVNLSLTANDTPQLRAAVADARRRDVLVVAAAGNAESGAATGNEGPQYP